MSLKLEAPMKAATSGIILENKRKTFSPDQCGSIANWAFKTTVLANHIRLIGEPFFSEHDRYAFAKDQTIPKGVQVWLARRNAGYLTARYTSQQRLVQGHQRELTPHLINPPLSPYRFKYMSACSPSVIFCCKLQPQDGPNERWLIVWTSLPFDSINSSMTMLSLYGLTMD
jgi:hypothetical protein